jgi:hypothetical protein
MAFKQDVVTEYDVEFKLEFNVKVSLNGTDPEYIKERLNDIIVMAIEMGDVTGETKAEVEDYCVSVHVVEDDTTTATTSK